jgi:hypothetical protein
MAVSIRPKGAGEVMRSGYSGAAPRSWKRRLGGATSRAQGVLRHADAVVVLVPRQLQMTGMTGAVPYYGGRFSPAQAYAASHPVRQPPPPPPPPPPRRDPVAALDELLESGVITEAEHEQLRDRLDP